DERVFTKANVGSMKLLWKVKLESTPRAMHNLFAPLVAERVTTPDGPRELAVVAGVTDDLFGIDVAAGKQIWHRRFDSTLAKPGGTNDTLCPGGRTAAARVPRAAGRSPPRRNSARAAASRTRSPCTVASSIQRRRRGAAG